MQRESELPQKVDDELAGLDFDFLRYMGVQPEIQRTIQEFYLPYFAGRGNVLDLGCGDGDFVKLMLDNGIQVTGVDFDDKARAAAELRNLPLVQDDVFHYLNTVPPESVDGIFSAHLVEHLPYERVVELIRLCFRALSPGGVIVLATPDVRSLYSHLEMFYLHFGHVSFYHPRLLCFFLDHAGFVETEYGTNPQTASPMMSELHHIGGTPYRTEIAFKREIPPQGDSLLHRLSYSLKRRLANWLVLPFVDDLSLNISAEMERMRAASAADMRTMAASLQSLNGPFECYAAAHKSPAPPTQPGGIQNAA